MPAFSQYGEVEVVLTLGSMVTDEGYRLTYGGYDFLACRTFAKRNTIYSVGNQIGTGKESGTFIFNSPVESLPSRFGGEHSGEELTFPPTPLAHRHLRRGRRRWRADGHENPAVGFGASL